MTETQISPYSSKSSANNRIPTVSIGMPVYNGEKYIRDALDSLLKQSFADFELIISDNASTDATESIGRQYAKNDARIRYLRQESNIGAAANFRFVLNQAGGSYFMWAACDDMWSLDWLEKLHEAIGEPDVGMVFGKVVHIDAEGQLLEHPANGASFNYSCDNSLLRRTKFYLAYEGLGKANTIYSLYQRELVETLNAMWSEMIGGECFHDYTIVFSCLRHKKLKEVEQAILFKRVHAASEGASQIDQSLTALSFLKKILGVLWPFPPKLIMDYLQHSTPTEKIILSSLIPIKLLMAFGFRLKQIVSKLRLNQS